MSYLLSDIYRLKDTLREIGTESLHTAADLRAWKIKQLELEIELMKLEIMLMPKTDSIGW